jgi:site-specific DNA-methyltransferase (adenine-specific)
MNEKMNELTKNEWYNELVEDCKAIITEAIFTSRWALVQGYWELGQRIREDKLAQEYSKGNKTFVTDLSRNIKVGYRDIYRALQLYDKYPDINNIPEGKNISWNKLITKYLPDIKEKEAPPLPVGEYNVIYADPPWEYNDGLIEGYGAAKHHYSTMSVDEICNINIPVAQNAVLFIWVTSPLLEDVFKVIKSWGFEYKASFVWDKVKHNFGHYNSVRHEFLLVCTKGSFTPQGKALRDSVVSIDRTSIHSQKPEVFYEIIEEMYPEGKYLELFARNKREGWDSWGNEL